MPARSGVARASDDTVRQVEAPEFAYIDLLSLPAEVSMTKAKTNSELGRQAIVKQLQYILVHSFQIWSKYNKMQPLQ